MGFKPTTLRTLDRKSDEQANFSQYSVYMHVQYSYIFHVLVPVHTCIYLELLLSLDVFLSRVICNVYLTQHPQDGHSLLWSYVQLVAGEEGRGEEWRCKKEEVDRVT